MKKIGYTLAEVLIALAIVGVLTAVTLPLASHFKPDGTKAIFLNTYDSLVQILNEVASNQNLYPINFYSNQFERTIDCSNGPLYNTDIVEIKKDNETVFESLGGNSKLCSILAETYGQQIDNCNLNQPYNNENFANNVNFTNNQGVDFSIYYIRHFNLVPPGTLSPTFISQISIDVNGSKQPNCRYSNTCKKPDRFTFLVAPNGHIEAADQMGQAYLATRESLRHRDFDTNYMNEFTLINSLNNVNNAFWLTSTNPSFIE